MEKEGSYHRVRIGEIGLDQTNPGVAVLSISGEHDLNTAPELRQRLDDLIGERTAIVVDLTPATFVDSSILGVILESRRRAIDAGLGFAVQHSDGENGDGKEAVARVLEITGLRSELPVHPDRGSALAGASDAGAGKAST